MSHADISPSSLGIALNCSASVTKARGKISLSGPAARRGTALHKAVELMLTGASMPEFVEVEGEIYFLTPEDKDAVELCWEAGEMLRLSADEFSVEERLSINWFFNPLSSPEPFHGTTDLIAYERAKKRRTIIDFKFGRHIVDPGGPQNRAYGFMSLADADADKPIEVVRLVIVQPQDEEAPIKSVEISVSELMQWADDVLIPTLKRIGEDDQTENPGDHCLWCKRAGECAALHARSIEIAQASFDDDAVPSPAAFTSADLGKILEKAELVEGWIRAVRAEVSHRLDVGEQINGWKLVPKRANRKWIDEIDLVEALEPFNLPAEDLYEPEKLRSPAQIEKALKRHGVDAKIVDAHVTRESSGSTLVRSSDPREKVIASRGTELFDDK